MTDDELAKIDPKELQRLADELLETNAELRELVEKYERELQAPALRAVTVRPVYGVRFGHTENGSAA